MYCCIWMEVLYMWGKIGAILMGCLDVCNYFCACDVYNFSLVMRAAMRTSCSIDMHWRLISL